MNRIVKTWLTLAALGLLLTASGCGQKGDLYRTEGKQTQTVITAILPA